MGQNLLTLDGEPLIAVQTIKSLDMILDTSLLMEAQVTNVAGLVFLHLFQARQLALYLSCTDLASDPCNGQLQARRL